jgi:hypothetical protein
MRNMELNEVGDVVLDNPEATWALADPVRLELLDRLRRAGPSTTAELGAEAASHLDELERVGLVERDTSVDPPLWTAIGKGIFFEIPDDPEGQAAARALTKVMLLQSEGLPRRWVDTVEPTLTADWARATGMFGARVRLTPAELERLQAQLEELLAPYTNRAAEAAPADAETVRILAYFLPDPS